jgi:two-component system, chemotaxis family, sensor kinase CheA
MTQYSDDRGAEMRELFFETSQELLQLLNDEALKLEEQPGDAELVRSIRRIVHTLKGDAAACGFRELSNAAHTLEDALALESAASHGRLAEVAFAAADTFAAMLTAYRHKGKLPSTTTLAKMIRELSAEPKTGEPKTGKSANPKNTKIKRSKKTADPVAAEPVEWTEYEKLAIQNARSSGQKVYQITTAIDPNCLMPIAARQLVLNALQASAEILGTRPEPGTPESSKRLLLLVASGKTVEQLTAQCRIPSVISGVSVVLIEADPGASKPASTQPAESKTQNAGHDSESDVSSNASPAGGEEHARTGKPTQPHAENILRVDADRIDSVLDLVGELIIGKSMLQQAFTEFSRHVPKEALRGRFSDAMAFQSRVLNELQRSVMKIRMVPVEQLFRRFPRMVRDVAKQCGKEVDLVVQGQDTDLDKSLLDAIAEPLTHLVRNAVSHGVETSEERVRCGKSPRGTIHLTSYHHGNQVIVEISDDGRGIDSQRIKTKAIETALITEEEADRMGESAILDLVFKPGFSTADEITEVSGRGVGMDVVQNVLHRLKGSVEIQTRTGLGTTFRLKLPLTLAIIRALLFNVEQRLYAIPLNAVAEIARAKESEIHQIHNYEILQLGNRVIPVVRLGRAPASGIETSDAKVFVLVISIGDRKLGLIVDSLRGEEELVIKALDDQSVATDLISGASILGDGRVVLIVNVPAIVERHNRVRSQQDESVISGLLLSHADLKNPVTNPSEVRQ